jgi:gliding motility-associated-like protein
MILNQSNGTLFVAKYNKDGRYQWAFNTGQGGAVDNSGFDLICDKDGNVVVTGYFQGHNIDFDPSQQVNSLTSNGSFEIFVAKYTNDGRFLWAKSAGGSGTDVGRAVTVDSQNNIYVTGDYNSSNINFNGSQTANILKNNGGNDLFLAKFSPAGQHVWSFSTGGSTNEYGMGIDRDAQNNILITGAFNGNNVDFDPSPNTISLSSNGQNDVYAVKYSADGNYLCAFSLGGANNDMGKSIVSHGPYSYVVGMFNGSNVNFNPSGITLFTSAAEDIFIAKYEWTVIPPAGSISGNLDCLTGQVTLTFNATAGTGPFTLYISNGTLTTSYRNIISGTPFTIAQNNATPTTYTLTGIKDANLCSAITPANSSAEIPAKLLQVKTSGLVTVCKGDSVEIYASGGQTYQWFPATGLSNAFSPTSKASPIVNTNYKVAVYAGANCVDTGFVTVNVREKPVVTVSPSVVMCTGDTIQLNAGGGVRYQWSPATDLNNPSISDPLVYPVNNSIFKVRVTNAEGCSDSSQVAVTITAKPKPFLGKDTSICHQATLNINATTPSAISYGWSTGEITPQITIDQPGIYTVSVGISGCILPATDTITIERKQAATISLGKDTIICDGDILALSANGSNIDGYQWSTGSTDSVININNGGLYHLTAMNSCGSVSDEIAVLTEFCADDLFFPTAFTPNNDGRNDHFRAAYLSGLKVYDYKLKIFNRWGNVVFKTSDVSQGWNGKVDGQQQMSDVFVFIASYKRSPTAPAVTKKGTMTLIR